MTEMMTIEFAIWLTGWVFAGCAVAGLLYVVWCLIRNELEEKIPKVTK